MNIKKKGWVWKMVMLIILLLVSGIIQWEMGFIDNKAMVGETDSFNRLSLIQGYAESKESVLSPFVKLPLEGVWLPGYFSFFVMLEKMGFGEVGLRTIMWICGLLVALMIWIITSKLMHELGSIWHFIIMFVFVMSPLMLQINTQMLAEPIMTLWLLFSLYLLLKGRNGWSIFFLFLSQTVRYESWFIVPMFWVYIGVFVKNVSVKRKGLLILGTMLFPMIWMILNATQSGGPLYFYTNKQNYLDYVFTSQYGNLWVALSAWATKLQQYISVEWFWLWISGIVGIMICGSRKQKWWGWLSIYSFAMVVLLLWLGSTEWFAPRFIYIVYILSVPILLIAIEMFIKVFNRTDFFSKMGILLLTIWMLNQYIQESSTIKKNVNEYFIPNQKVKEVSDYLENKIYVNQDEKVIYLWINASPWLVCDFNYYLKDRNFWRINELKNSDDLAKMKMNNLLIAERGLIKEEEGFDKLYDNYLFQIWAIK